MKQDITFCVFIGFIFAHSAWGQTSKVSKDILSFYDTYRHNLIVKEIESQSQSQGQEQDQKEESPDSKASKFLIIKDLQQNFLQLLLLKYPENIFLHYNFGVLWNFKDIQKSVMQFLSVLKMDGPDELKFQAAFNLGNLYGYEDHFDIEQEEFQPGYRLGQAIKYYQMALDINPDSLKTRQNIEMLFVKASLQQNLQDGQNSNEQQQGEGDESQEDSNIQEERDQTESKRYQENNQKQRNPPEFKSKNLSPKDVQDILEELKQQEQQIWEQVIQEESHKQQRRQGRDSQRHWLFEDTSNDESSTDGVDKDW